jgi:thiol-disulfide isomerase/thioredoxin
MKYLVGLLIILWLSVSSFGQKEYTAYIFMAEDCPVCNYLGKSLKSLSLDYEENVSFVAVFPQKMSNIKTASLFKKKYGLTLFDIEIDYDRTLTNRYNASVTPEVILVDNNDNVLYQGRINDAYAAPGRMRHGSVREDLKLAIEQILNSQEVAKPWPDPIGCYITKR